MTRPVIITVTKPAPVVDAAICCSCGALKTKACHAFYPGGGWNPYGGKGVQPCPAVLS